MSIRFVIAANFSEAADEDVLIDAHHISSDGEWFQHPIRAHQLRVGGSIPLLAHIALGFVLHKGTRQELLLCFTHAEPTAHHGLELVVTQVPPHPAAQPGAQGIDQGGASIEPVELSRQVLAPGASMPLSLYVGTHVRIREVLLEADRG